MFKYLRENLGSIGLGICILFFIILLGISMHDASQRVLQEQKEHIEFVRKISGYPDMPYHIALDMDIVVSVETGEIQLIPK